jgi:hypothetical protein
LVDFCGFRGEDFFKSANQKQELPMAAMFANGSEQNEQSLERTFHKFHFIWLDTLKACF